MWLPLFNRSFIIWHNSHIESLYFHSTVCVSAGDTHTKKKTRRRFSCGVDLWRGSVAGKRKVENHKATPPILPSDTPCAQTLINWVKFDMCVCLQQRQRGYFTESFSSSVCTRARAYLVCVFLCLSSADYRIMELGEAKVSYSKY